MAFVSQSNRYPQGAWTRETRKKMPAQRAWTVEEIKMPHRPNSDKNASRNVFRGAVVVENKSFQNNNDILEDFQETDPRSQFLKAVQTPDHLRNAAKTNLSKDRDVNSTDKDDNVRERPSLSTTLVTLIVIVAIASVAALALTALILTGFFETKNRSGTAIEGSYPFNDDFTKLSNYIQGLENNITTFKKNLEKMEEMITNESNTKPAMWRAIETNSKNITKINLKVINVSKMHGPQGEPGPQGPPGHNGTQGPPGPPGLRAHNDTDGSRSISFSQCHYKEKKSVQAQPGDHVTSDVEIVEKNGKKFLGVNCGTNDAKVVKFKTPVNKNGTTTYRCDCKGTLNSGAKLMFCYIRYWECPA